MSVFVKGMEMPQCCEECRFFAWKRGVGQHCAVDDRITFHATLDGFDVGYERNGDCPLVLVPPHGRLIDADGEIGVNVTMMPGGKCRVDLIASTIIPPEEGE